MEHIVPGLGLDIVQLPMNILDQRLIDSGYLIKLKNEGYEIHARSVFLQGLLLMDYHKIPAYFNRYKVYLDAFHDRLKQEKISALQACLGFVKNTRQIDRIIVGINSAEQLEEVIATTKQDIKLNRGHELACKELGLINPSNWPRGL